MTVETDSPFDYDEAEIRGMTEHLVQCAREGRRIHYEDAYEVARQWGEYYGPHHNKL